MINYPVVALTLLFMFMSIPFLSVSAQDRPVNDIIYNVPKDLATDTLLIPRYDFLEPEPDDDGGRMKYIVAVNKQAKKGNTTINELAMKSYPFPYKLISMSEIGWYKNNGYKYFMDMALMPKQMKTAEPRALVAAYEKFETSNEMYKNRNSMWNFYFYIRDIQTNDAYMTTKLKGSFEVYRCMQAFFGRAGRDVTGESMVGSKFNAVKGKFKK